MGEIRPSVAGDAASYVLGPPKGINDIVIADNDRDNHGADCGEPADCAGQVGVGTLGGLAPVVLNVQRWHIPVSERP